MRQKSLYLTDSAAGALERAARIASKSQHSLMMEGVISRLRTVKDVGVQALLDNHEGEMGAREDARIGRPNKVAEEVLKKIKQK